MNLFLQTQHYLSKGSKMACTPLLAALLLSATSYAADRETALGAVNNLRKEAARINVTGTVKDNKGEPLPGVSVKIKGTTTATSTDVNGVFRLNLPTGNETLVLSFIGFQTQEVQAKGQTSFTITMQESASQLEEVVVVGYGTQKRAHLTGAVETISGSALEDQPAGNLATTMAGRLAGVSVNGGGISRPGAAAQVIVRNPIFLGKDGGGLDPLYVIDDVVRTPEDFNILDPTEVESISVLKDAAGAIYGARASQGVIVVKTRRGQAGATRINYSGSLGQSDARRMPDVLSAYEHARYLNAIIEAENNYNPADYVNRPQYYTEDELEHFKGLDYNWLDMAWKPAYLTRHALNVSGGSDRATYFAGMSYYYQNGNFDKIDNDKWTFRASADVKATKSLKLGLSLSGDLSSVKKAYSKVNSNENADFQSLVSAPRWIPPYIGDHAVPVSTSGNARYHYFEVLNSGNYKHSRNTGLNAQINLDYDVPFIKGLKLRGVYARMLNNDFNKEYGTFYNIGNFGLQGEHQHIYGGPETLTGLTRVDNGDRLFFTPAYMTQYQANGIITYNREFGKHSISALAAYEQQEMYYETVRSTREGLAEGGLDYANFAFGASDVGQIGNRERALMSYLGRLNYNYGGKYLVEFSFRNDASTKLAPENRWKFFPSMSAGWVVSEESFFKDVTAVNFLKVRGSLGLSGGDAVRDWIWRQRYTFNVNGAVFGPNSSQRNMGLKLESIPNRAVDWDYTLKRNLGLDLAFLDSRLSVTADAFLDKHYRKIIQKTSSVPSTVGGTLPEENFGKLNTFGGELTLGWKDAISKDLTYSIGGFLAWNDNKLILVDQATLDKGTYLDKLGRSNDRGVFGYKYAGMFRSQAEVDAYLAQNPNYTIFGQAPKPGMLYYHDIRGPRIPGTNEFEAADGIITDVDQDFLTNKENNHYSIGLNLGGSWKSLKFNTVISGSFGGKALIEATSRGSSTANLPAFWNDYWTPENTDAAYPNPAWDDTYDVPSSFWFRSAFQLGMRSFNISYGLPQKVISTMKIRSANIYLTGTNPLNFYNPYDYKDNTGSWDVYPSLRSVSLGVNVGF